ncbi:MAG: alpha-E domain-containing protein [candidate division Zixibacteria bacterium]|nr:alpha-E domain-containing protein [candidate division Zixibacteria bacterium]
MLSRVADAIYWMSRYVERAENTARFIDVNLHLMLDLPAGFARQWKPLIAVTGDETLFQKRYGQATEEHVVEFLTFDRSYPNSIVSCLSQARENARSIREIISSEMWEHLNAFFLTVQNTRPDLAADAPHDFYTEVKMGCHLMAGITNATMSHGEGWHFGRLGGMMERADKTLRILDVKYFILLPQVQDVGTPFDNIGWSALLKSASALEMYRIAFGLIHPSRVAEFLILHPEFPRAIHYCLRKADRSLHAIAGSPAGTFANEPERLLGHLCAELSYRPIGDIIGGGLHEFLDMFQYRLNEIDQTIFDTFFALRPIQKEKS